MVLLTKTGTTKGNRFGGRRWTETNNSVFAKLSVTQILATQVEMSSRRFNKSGLTYERNLKGRDEGRPVAQPVEHLTPDFSSGHDLLVPEFEPDAAQTARDALPPPLSLFFSSLSK